MKAKLLCALIAGLLLAATPARAEAPRVVASIAPIHSLVAAVMEGVGEPALLMEGSVSVHDFSLKPSDLRTITNADLVVWVGEGLETYLVKPLKTEGVANLELLGVKGMSPHTYGAEDADQEKHAANNEPEDEHDHGRLDPHVWLDPVRAVTIVDAVAERLVAIDPDNADLYETNARLAVAALKALDSEIGTQLAPLGAKPFVTFHDAYSYFVERYGLNQVGELTVDPEQRPGAATLSALRKTVEDEGVVCAFVEPQFDPGVVRTMAGDSNMRVGTLDPLGADLDPGPLLYGTLMRKNADAVASCLSPNS